MSRGRKALDDAYALVDLVSALRFNGDFSFAEIRGRANQEAALASEAYVELIWMPSLTHGRAHMDALVEHVVSAALDVDELDQYGWQTPSVADIVPLAWNEFVQVCSESRELPRRTKPTA